MGAVMGAMPAIVQGGSAIFHGIKGLVDRAKQRKLEKQQGPGAGQPQIPGGGPLERKGPGGIPPKQWQQPGAADGNFGGAAQNIYNQGNEMYQRGKDMYNGGRGMYQDARASFNNTRDSFRNGNIAGGFNSIGQGFGNFMNQAGNMFGQGQAMYNQGRQIVDDVRKMPGQLGRKMYGYRQ